MGLFNMELSVQLSFRYLQLSKYAWLDVPLTFELFTNVIVWGNNESFEVINISFNCLFQKHGSPSAFIKMQVHFQTVPFVSCKMPCF